MEDGDYVQIAKGRGFLYANANYLYKQVKKKGEVRYVKCIIDVCDGSGKLEGGKFVTGVSKRLSGLRCLLDCLCAYTI